MVLRQIDLNDSTSFFINSRNQSEWPKVGGMKTNFSEYSLPRQQTRDDHRITLCVATSQDREGIYRLRHEVYARELAQHAANPLGTLRDPLDDSNIYLVAKTSGQIAGFISL